MVLTGPNIKGGFAGCFLVCHAPHDGCLSFFSEPRMVESPEVLTVEHQMEKKSEGPIVAPRVSEGIHGHAAAAGKGRALQCNGGRDHGGRQQWCCCCRASGGPRTGRTDQTAGIGEGPRTRSGVARGRAGRRATRIVASRAETE